MQNRLLRCSLLLTLALSQPALAADDQTQCQEQIPQWVPGEYFGPGIIVRYEGHWYKSRLLQSGNEPGGTNMFAWESVKAPPHCAATNTAGTPSSSASASQDHRNDTDQSAKTASDTAPPKKPSVAATPRPLPTSTDEARREAEQRQENRPADGNKPANALAHVLNLDKPDKPLTKTACSQVTRWSFTDSYTVGSLVSFQGQFYRSIRPTTGDMPGKSIPPRWEPIKLPCASQ